MAAFHKSRSANGGGPGSADEGIEWRKAPGKLQTPSAWSNRKGGLAMSSDKEILALEDKRYAAMCSGDFAALEAMLHDELLYTHSSGLTDTKVTWLASLRSGKTKYKSAACSDRKVRLVGDTAL